jgi:putative transposase
MSNYRRYFVPGAMYFFTVVTYNRRPILTTKEGRNFLSDAIRTIAKTRPFRVFATVLLPDHWHLVIQLPPNDSDYSTRMKRVKEEFTRNWIDAGLLETRVTSAQRAKGERGIWQPRFWEHTIEDEADLEGCIDYIHWNPRKHNLVARVQDYPWSSFRRFVRAGHYELDWGGIEPETLAAREDWGEPA